MGILDGGIRDLFGSVFAGIYLDGKLHKKTSTSDGKGGGSDSYSETDIKLQEDSIDNYMRQEEGYTDTDVKLIVLQAALNVVPEKGDIVEQSSNFWKVGSIKSDPAKSHWIIRGVVYKGSL